MKHALKILTVLIFCGLAAESNAQTGSFSRGKHPSWVMISAGSSHPVGEFKDFAQSGVDFGLTYDLALSRNWGLGANYNAQINQFTMPLDRFKIPNSGTNYQITSSSINSWASHNFGFGPWWMIQPGGPSSDDDGFFIKIYSNPGVSVVNSAEARTTITSRGASEDLFTMQQQNEIGFGVTSGVRINWALNKKLSVFVNPQHVYTSPKINYSFKDLTYANSTGEFNAQVAMFDTPAETKSINPNYFNINVGVSLKLCCWTITALDEEERK